MHTKPFKAEFTWDYFTLVTQLCDATNKNLWRATRRYNLIFFVKIEPSCIIVECILIENFLIEAVLIKYLGMGHSAEVVHVKAI